MKILLDISPTKNGHSHRGIGLYADQLAKHLLESNQIELITDMSQTKTKPDIVHFPFFDLFSHSLPIIRPARKSIVTIHDLIPLQFPEYYKPGLKGTLALAAQRLSLRSVDAIVTDSVSSKKSIEEFFNIAEEKIHVVYLAGNPMIGKQSAAVIAQVASRYQLPAQYILYVGDINYNKNIPQLIKSLKYLPDDIHLVLLGKNFRKQDIPEWQWIETQIALSDVMSRVTFINEFSDKVEEDISAIYSAARVYVQPSLAEGFGLPVLEAMQCQTPVVCTNETSLPEVAGVHAQYCETSAESISEAINDVLNFSQSKRKKMVEDAYNWSQKFSWKMTAQNTVNVYKQVLKQ